MLQKSAKPFLRDSNLQKIIATGSFPYSFGRPISGSVPIYFSGDAIAPTFTAVVKVLKNPAAYYLLLIYLFALCKPVMPLLQDAIAHIFFEQEHLATVHQHSGAGHVSKETGKLAADEHATNKPAGQKAGDETPLHLVVSCEINFCNSRHLPAHSSQSPYCFFPLVFPAIQLPPPRV